MPIPNTKFPEGCVIRNHPDAVISIKALFDIQGAFPEHFRISTLLPDMGIGREAITAVQHCEQKCSGCLGQLAVAS